MAAVGSRAGQRGAIDYATSGGSGSDVGKDIQRSAGGSVRKLAPTFGAIRERMGCVERPRDIDRAKSWRPLCEFLGKSAPCTGRQRRPALRISRRPAIATGFAG